jgi:RNA polymerase sigma-70 factor (ECF subfamily)
VAESPAVAEPHRQPEPLLGAGLGSIYREHFTLVWRGLRRLGVPDAALEDAAQDVFLIVHRRASEFAQRSSLRTWIFGIVVRVAKDYRRAERRRSRRIASVASELAVNPGAARTPADEAERREANRVLHSLLAALDEELRDVLVLVEFEELSTQDAAALLGIRVRTCQRRLRGARAAFDAALAAHLNASRRTP